MMFPSNIRCGLEIKMKHIEASVVFLEMAHTLFSLSKYLQLLWSPCGKYFKNADPQNMEPVIFVFTFVSY